MKRKDCQEHKLAGRGYGFLPKWKVWIAPWLEVAIDLIGPWKVKVNGGQVEFNVLSCIDTALNLVELICVVDKTAKHIHDKFTQIWLCRYPPSPPPLYDFYMATELNSSGRTFTGYWKSLASRMYAQPAKICNLMQSVKGCIRR